MTRTRGRTLKRQEQCLLFLILWTTSRQWLVCCHAFLPPFTTLNDRLPESLLYSSKNTPTDDAKPVAAPDNNNKNRAYIEGLLENLTGQLDQWICTGSPSTKEAAYNVLDQIQRTSQQPDLSQQAVRLAQRAGLPAPKQQVVSAGGPSHDRSKEANDRQAWEDFRQKQQANASRQKEQANVRSALGQRSLAADRPDIFMGHFDLTMESAASDKAELEATLFKTNESTRQQQPQADPRASARVSKFVALAGAGSAFDPITMGIGGLDDVLAQVKRRIWTPLAAPPQLLDELGIHPVRGLLLYGRPGCGKTLLARSLGQILSPLRPITIVSGPEIMDKFVGSSEKNLREIFDNPPDIYESFRIGERDNGEAIAQAALHVIVMDEFDAIARTRGGRGGSGDQGDAGVARDSVVNQMLAKMDGVDPLTVPTLVIGLTNKRSLIEPALLRPGRFEVQIEVPPPRSLEQRMSILRVHTTHMHQAGRLLVQDAPEGSAAAREAKDKPNLLTYEKLLQTLAEKCDGYSGASLAGVARAAASHALERAVEDFSEHYSEDRSLLQDCVVTIEDFESAVTDVLESVGDSDWAEDTREVVEEEIESKQQEDDPKITQGYGVASELSK